MPKANSPSLSHDARDPKQPEVCDDHFAVVVEDVLGFQIFVHDALGVEVPHALKDRQPHVRGRGKIDNGGLAPTLGQALSQRPYPRPLI